MQRERERTKKKKKQNLLFPTSNETNKIYLFGGRRASEISCFRHPMKQRKRKEEEEEAKSLAFDVQ